MTHQETIKKFVEKFESFCDETANDIASRFFNCDADIDDDGDIWVRGLWANEDRLADFVGYLEEMNHI